MGDLTVIFLSFAAVLLAYAAYRILLCFFAKRELASSKCACRRAGTLEIYAAAESLEYLLHMANALPGAKITVYISKSSADACECEYIAQAFSREFKKIRIKYIP